MDKLIFKYNKKMEHKEIECFECDGQGQIEGSTPVCFKPASQCCGGCYPLYECKLCQGRGTLFSINEEVEDIFLMLEGYEKMIVGYEKTLSDFKKMIRGVSENGLLEMELMLDETHEMQLEIIRHQLKRIKHHKEVLRNEIRKQYE